jgi:hypothetical protein
MKDRVDEIYELVNEMGKVRDRFGNYKTPADIDGIIYCQLETNSKLDMLIKMGLYNQTVEALKTKLKDELGVEDEVIKTLKNKKELVSKIMEVM